MLNVSWHSQFHMPNSITCMWLWLSILIRKTLSLLLNAEHWSAYERFSKTRCILINLNVYVICGVFRSRDNRVDATNATIGERAIGMATRRPIVCGQADNKSLVWTILRDFFVLEDGYRKDSVDEMRLTRWGEIWRNLGNSEMIWRYLEKSEQIWRNLEKSGRRWWNMWESEKIWGNLKKFGKNLMKSKGIWRKHRSRSE